VANVNPWTEAKVDTDSPDRGPLLFIIANHGRRITACRAPKPNF
jgi:hypothetical protein